MKNVNGVIFDLDGTLLDSMWMWGDVAVRYITSRGAVPRPGFREAIRSLNTIEEAQYYIDEYGIDLPLADVIDGRNSLMMEFFSGEVKLKKGVITVLDALQKRGIKMCIATATERELVEPALKYHGIEGYFMGIFTCAEEKTNKKSPDIFIRAAACLGTAIYETLVVEDALYAMETAERTGFIVAGVYDTVSDDHQDEIKALCKYYWKDLDEMLAYL